MRRLYFMVCAFRAFRGLFSFITKALDHAAILGSEVDKRAQLQPAGMEK